MNMTIFGYKIRTTNQNAQSMTDMGQLWERFMAGNPNTAQKIYVVYTHYENQDQGFYDVYIGTQEHLAHFYDKIDVEIEKYTEFESEYHSPNDVVSLWKEIWGNPNLQRQYSFDVEEYDFENKTVKIYLSVK